MNTTSRLKKAEETKVDYLLGTIERLQAVDPPIYPDGLFPSQRFHAYLPYKREDSNIFFTALIVFTLQSLQSKLTDSQKEITDSICKKAIKNYPLFKSRRGLKTYNFWQNTNNKQFPHGYLLNKLKFLELPDDIDDSALIYLTSKQSQQDALWLKTEMEKHANQSKAQIKNTMPKFRHLKAYTTWFGKNMYLEFDFCVLCNALYFVYHYKLPLNEHDEDSIQYLKEVIETDLHFSNPFLVAPSYPKTALILYHITRLVTSFDIPALYKTKEIIRLQITGLLNIEQPQMDKILLATSLARLSVKTNVKIDANNLNFKGYYFFNGGMLTAFENRLTRKLAPYSFFHMKHTCEAYYYTLLLEYELLKGLEVE